jgi:ABC-type transport system substrate-binding protein
MLMGGWWPDWPDPDSLVYNMLRSDTYAGKWAGYNSSQMDSLTAEGRGISDLTSPQRIQIYHQIQELYAQDLPMLEYVNVKQVVFTRSDVHGFVVNFIPMLVDLTPVYKD